MSFDAIKTEYGRWMQHHQLYPLLGMKAGDHLPKEGFTKVIDGVRIICEPATGARSKHRLKVNCSCGKLIPFGRMGQHMKGKEHRS